MKSIGKTAFLGVALRRDAKPTPLPARLGTPWSKIGPKPCRMRPFGLASPDWRAKTEIPVNVLLSSDIGHFDVADITSVLAEAHELVEHGVLDEEQFLGLYFRQPGEVLGLIEPGLLQGHQGGKRGR